MMGGNYVCDVRQSIDIRSGQAVRHHWLHGRDHKKEHYTRTNMDRKLNSTIV